MVEYNRVRDKRFIPIEKVKEGYVYNLVELDECVLKDPASSKVKYSYYVKVKTLELEKLVILYHKLNSPGSCLIEDLSYYGYYWGLQYIL